MPNLVLGNSFLIGKKDDFAWWLMMILHCIRWISNYVPILMFALSDNQRHSGKRWLQWLTSMWPFAYIHKVTLGRYSSNRAINSYTSVTLYGVYYDNIPKMLLRKSKTYVSCINSVRDLVCWCLAVYRRYAVLWCPENSTTPRNS